MRVIYNKLADTYDFRSNNPTTALIREKEEKLIKKYSKGKILDFGCGTGYHLNIQKEGITDIVGSDISEGMLKVAAKYNKNLVQCSESLPFKYEKFDTLLCLYSVLNLLDCKKAVKEFSKILSPGGHVLLSVSSIWDNDGVSLRQKLRSLEKPGRKRFRIEKQFMEMQLFKPKEITDIFTDEGFELKKFDSLFRLQKPVWGNFQNFSIKKEIKLKLEKLLPKSYGCFYFFIFEKTK